MRILAIDPSSTCIGWAIFQDYLYITSGHIYIKGGKIEEKLMIIKRSLYDLCNVKIDIALVEVNFLPFSRNTKYINIYQFFTGFIVGILSEITEVELVPVPKWKRNKSEEKVAEEMKVLYGKNIKNRDELSAIGIGHWFTSLKRILDNQL